MRSRPSRSGTPTSSSRSTSTPAGSRCRRTQPYDNAFKVQWELFLRARGQGHAVPLDPAGRGQGRAARRVGLRVVAEAALGGRAGVGVKSGPLSRLPLAARRERVRFLRCHPIRIGTLHRSASTYRPRPAWARRTNCCSPTVLKRGPTGWQVPLRHWGRPGFSRSASRRSTL